MENLTIAEYQQEAMTTCLESSRRLSYMLLGLQEEVGELSGKFAKAIRSGKLSGLDEESRFNLNEAFNETDMWEYIASIKKELGDCLWFIAGICEVMGMDLEEIAYGNLDKLASRKERGVIDGDGDNR